MPLHNKEFMPADWNEPDKLNQEWANREPVPAVTPSPASSDAPVCTCNVEVRNLTKRRVEGTLDCRVLLCPLHEAAAQLYTALLETQECLLLSRQLPLAVIKERLQKNAELLAKSRGFNAEKP